MRVSAFVAISVDGFIARPDGSTDWMSHHGAGSANGNATDFGFGKFYESVDALLIDRDTFARRLAEPIWPYGTRRIVVISPDYVDIPATLARHVSSSTADPGMLLAQMAGDQVAHVFVDGAGAIQQCLAEGLISHMTLTRIPVLLGRGIGLSEPLPRDQLLEHLRTEVFAGGVIQSSYNLIRTAT